MRLEPQVSLKYHYDLTKVLFYLFIGSIPSDDDDDDGWKEP